VAIKVHRTEHAGAKNRGGFWGLRVDAKAGSRKVRRVHDRRAVAEGRADHESQKRQSG